MRHHAPLAHRFPVCIHCQRRLHRRNCCSRRWLTTASRSTRGWVSSPPPTPSVALAPSVPSIYRTVAPWCSYYSVGSSSTHTGVCLLQLGMRPQGISSVLSIFSCLLRDVVVVRARYSINLALPVGHTTASPNIVPLAIYRQYTACGIFPRSYLSGVGSVIPATMIVFQCKSIWRRHV